MARSLAESIPYVAEIGIYPTLLYVQCHDTHGLSLTTSVRMSRVQQSKTEMHIQAGQLSVKTSSLESDHLRMTTESAALMWSFTHKHDAVPQPTENNKA